MNTTIRKCLIGTCFAGGHDRPQRNCGKRRGHHQRQGRTPFRNAGGSASNSAGQPRRNITWTVGGIQQLRRPRRHLLQVQGPLQRRPPAPTAPTASVPERR